jgi:hypothetical protein
MARPGLPSAVVLTPKERARAGLMFVTIAALHILGFAVSPARLSH